MSDPRQLAVFMRAELCKRSFRTFVETFRPGYQFNWHHELLIEALQHLGDRKIKQLIVAMPPRHGKSELVSRLFPAWLLARQPNEQIIACSYAFSLASAMSRDCQRVITSPKYIQYFPKTKLSDGSDVGFTRSAQRFDVVGHSGHYVAAGVGGGITGAGATVGIVDDPIKDAAEADSPVVRSGIWEWYTSTFLTRQEPNYVEAILATRWNQDDLTGRVLKQEREGRVIINFPAIAEQDEAYRKAGEALWQDKFSVEALRAIQSTTTIKSWNALYQQSPSPADGDIFKKLWFRYYKPHEIDLSAYPKRYYVDTAYTDQEKNDPCGFLCYCRVGADYYIIRYEGKYLNFPDQMDFLKKFVQSTGYTNKSIVRVEPKATGKSLVQTARKATDLNITEGRVPTKSKVARANECTGVVQGGRVYLPEGELWTDNFVTQLITFPNAKHDEEVDCLTGMILNDRQGIVSASA